MDLPSDVSIGNAKVVTAPGRDARRYPIWLTAKEAALLSSLGNNDISGMESIAAKARLALNLKMK